MPKQVGFDVESFGADPADIRLFPSVRSFVDHHGGVGREHFVAQMTLISIRQRTPHEFVYNFT